MNTFSDSLLVAYHLILTLDSALWEIVLRSLTVSGLSILFSAPLAIILGALIASTDFKLKPFCELALNAMLAMPSVVLGLLVYLLLSFLVTLHPKCPIRHHIEIESQREIQVHVFLSTSVSSNL